MELNTAHDTLEAASENLAVGTVLSGDQFTITDTVGAGGFGKTYLARDNVLGRTIVIKECFPEDFCYRDGNNVLARNAAHADKVRSIVEMFMSEARSLAKLRHPNIVGVHRAFEENKTAYMVLDHIDGRDLIDIVGARKAPLPPSRVQDILIQLLDAIEKVHALDLLHRDISPDNIIIEKTGNPVLIDFGAARSDASRRTRALSSLHVVKDGYSPQEFYVPGSFQTPSSDLYALAATFYHVLSGKAPTSSQARTIEVAGGKPDPCVPLAGRIEGYEPEFLQAIDTAMKIHPNERLQTAAQWRDMIWSGEDESELVRKSRPRSQEMDVNLDISLTNLVEEINDEVRKTRVLAAEAEEVAAAQEKAAEQKEAAASLQDTIAQMKARDELSDEVNFNDDGLSGDPEDLYKNDARVSYITPEPTHSETNWVSRALEKQERIREEREREFEETVAQVKSKPRSRLIEEVEPADPIEFAPEQHIAPSQSINPIALYAMAAVLTVAALIFLGIMFLFPALP